MSAEHDTAAAHPTPGRARASLSQLRQMWGTLDITDPARIIRVGMYGHKEVWRRMAGSGSGQQAQYELEGED